MTKLAIVQIVENPANVQPEYSGLFARCYLEEKNRWTVHLMSKKGVELFYRQTHSTNSVQDLLGFMHAWSRSDLANKYIFMTEEASKILLPAMVVPVVEFQMAVSTPQ